MSKSSFSEVIKCLDDYMDKIEEMGCFATNALHGPSRGFVPVKQGAQDACKTFFAAFAKAIPMVKGDASRMELLRLRDELRWPNRPLNVNWVTMGKAAERMKEILALSAKAANGSERGTRTTKLTDHDNEILEAVRKSDDNLTRAASNVGVTRQYVQKVVRKSKKLLRSIPTGRGGVSVKPAQSLPTGGVSKDQGKGDRCAGRRLHVKR